MSSIVGTAGSVTGGGDTMRPDSTYRQGLYGHRQTSQGNAAERRHRITWEGQVALVKLTAILAIIWALFFALIGITDMPNGDMAPNINMGDMMLFYRLDKDVRPQDVVVVRKEVPEGVGAAGSTGQGGHVALAALRVIAVAGDTVSIKDGCVLVNGNAQVEGNIFYLTQPYEGYEDGEITLGEGQCYVLGDHRSGAMDSRVFGAVDAKDIVGTVLTIVRRNGI